MSPALKAALAVWGFSLYFVACGFAAGYFWGAL